ncbi:unnamed protein product [Angiostrongylus costaricensis]|uniref:DNA-directed RNA polymerase n=1 Tax=Angiostrongylus costaricensis TaxID=334426 RepID=A0A0R3PFF8_ANGCS|nr:unnamed protein product [Angiostrongylus costaricensis]
MQNSVKSQLLDMFSYAILVSPSCFVRAAILEAVNVPLDECIRFSDGSETFPATFLVGHSLHSLVSLFLRSRFSSQSNTWPITVHTAGVAYYNKVVPLFFRECFRNTKGIVDLAHSRQRLKHCVLALANSDKQMDGFVSECAAKISSLMLTLVCFWFSFTTIYQYHLEALLCDDLMLDVKNRFVLGKELGNYESQAVVSRIGDYIARRLNITVDSGEFVRMAYMETDVDRIIVRLIDRLIEGKDIPKKVHGHRTFLQILLLRFSTIFLTRFYFHNFSSSNIFGKCPLLFGR